MISAPPVLGSVPVDNCLPLENRKRWIPKIPPRITALCSCMCFPDPWPKTWGSGLPQGLSLLSSPRVARTVKQHVRPISFFSLPPEPKSMECPFLHR